MKLHPLGRLHCPACNERRPFVGFDDPDPSAARCLECGYQFGFAADPVTGDVRSVLTREVVQEARAELLEEQARDALTTGVTPLQERTQELLELPPDQRREALRQLSSSAGKPGWTADQWRSFAAYQRTLGTPE